MNIKKLGKRLNKINLLFQSIKEEGSASKIERELLLSYLRDAYEYATETSDEATQAPARPRYEEPEVHVPVSRPTPTPKVIEQIVQEEIVPEPIAAVPQQPAAAPTPAPEPVPATPAAPESVDVSDALSAIFAQADVSELSDRLSMSPIKDMTKAMGINERIFTVKELFGGDNDVFNSILQRINGCSSYDEASEYLLTGIARDQDWANESKLKKAETFMKLVKRRFV